VAAESLSELESAIRASWSVWTSDPVDHAQWSPECPSRGQCAVTSLVVQDLFGGELLMAEVTRADGSRQGVHYWNRLVGGVELDLTREQFTAGEAIGTAAVVPRPVDITRGRPPGQYHLLSAGVRRHLAGEAVLEPRPVSVKGVVVDDRGRVLLCRTARGDWELPGGRPELGELFPAALEREVREETGFEVAVDRVLGAEALEVVPGAWVDIVSYACAVRDPAAALRASSEHSDVAFLDLDRVASVRCPDAYRRAIGAVAGSEIG
jgi:8-oxo-dGTP pyrophosphatase MutT (NUDIX family)